MRFAREWTSILFFLAAVLLLCCQSKQKADLILHHGKVYTVDSAFTVSQAFAVSDGKIISVGSNEEILNNYKAEEVIDAGGKTVYPGFIDAHVHFVWYGQSLFTVDLVGSSSFEEVIGRVKTFHKKHPDAKIIEGRGWDQNNFAVKQFPSNEMLNAEFSNIPVILHRIDAHALLANQKALELARIQPNQKISGGEIIVKNGKLTGLLIDNAVTLLLNVLPKPTRVEYETWLTAAEAKCFEYGITTVTECGLDFEEVQRIDSIQKEGKLNMRLYVMLWDKKKNYDYFLPKGPYKTDKLFVKGFKVLADGALGSRGACLLNAYEDKPGWKGFLLRSPQHFDSVASLLSTTEFQMCTHAIGDSTNRLILQTYNKCLKGKNDKRWRIEHAQIISKNDFDLFGSASIIPSVQPTAAISDMPWAKDRVGEVSMRGGYAYKQLLAQNNWIALGTDFPVDDLNPIKTFYSAVFRKDAKGFPADGFQSQNALSRREALMGMTLWAAKAGFLEKEIGSIEAGKDADFVILDTDLMEAEEEKVLLSRVLFTYSRGIKR